MRILPKNSSKTTLEENNSKLKKKPLDGQRLPTNFDRKPYKKGKSLKDMLVTARKKRSTKGFMPV